MNLVKELPARIDKKYMAQRIMSLKGQSVSLKKRNMYLFPLSEDQNVWLIQSGHVMVMRSSASGNFKAFSILGSGDIFGVSIFGGTNRDVTLAALNTVQLYCVPIKSFERLIKEDHDFSQAMFYYTCGRLSTLLDESEQVAFCNLEERLQALDKKIQQLPNIGEPFRMSETVAAWAVGAHPVSVCRALKGKKITFQNSSPQRGQQSIAGNALPQVIKNPPLSS